MRYCALNATTDQPMPTPPPGGPIPADMKFVYLPRIRCHDCPGKLYTPGPETTVGNFEVHLKNRQHREKVDTRVGRATGKTGSSAVAAATAASAAQHATAAAASPAAAHGAAPPASSPGSGRGASGSAPPESSAS